MLTLHHLQDTPGFSWNEIQESSQPWLAFENLSLSWATFEKLIKEYHDPEAGYTWEEIFEEDQVWQALEDLNMSWGVFEALIPGGNWEDEINVKTKQGDKVILQLNAKNIKANKPITFKIQYDPESLTWSNDFVQSNYGILVNDLHLPKIISHEDGQIELQIEKNCRGKWSGVTAALQFTANKNGTATIILDK